MVMILYFEGEGVFILKKEDDEESIKVVKSRSFSFLLFLVFTINACMFVHNIVGNFCFSIIITVLFTVCYYHFKGIASKRNEQGQDQKEETKGIRAVLDLLCT